MNTTATLTLQRTNEVIRLKQETDWTYKKIAEKVSEKFGGITISGVSMIIRRAGLSEKRIPTQISKRDRYRRPDDGDHVFRPAGEPDYPTGFCLQCKGGAFTHPEWPNGKCPCCGGSGRYPWLEEDQCTKQP